MGRVLVVLRRLMKDQLLLESALLLGSLGTLTLEVHDCLQSFLAQITSLAVRPVLRDDLLDIIGRRSFSRVNLGVVAATHVIGHRLGESAVEAGSE